VAQWRNGSMAQMQKRTHDLWNILLDESLVVDLCEKQDREDSFDGTWAAKLMLPSWKAGVHGDMTTEVSKSMDGQRYEVPGKWRGQVRSCLENGQHSLKTRKCSRALLGQGQISTML
jgi:hypothetical protein